MELQPDSIRYRFKILTHSVGDEWKDSEGNLYLGGNDPNFQEFATEISKVADNYWIGRAKNQ